MIDARMVALASLALLGCHRTRVPRPPVGPHLAELERLVIVDYPPPPARAEVVEPRTKGSTCVWLDGHHEWEARRWRWRPGGWVEPPPGCHYAAGVVFWQARDADESVLYYRVPGWYPDRPSDAMPVCSAPRPCTDDPAPSRRVRRRR